MTHKATAFAVGLACALAAGCGGEGGDGVSVLSPAWSVPHETSAEVAAYWTRARVRAAQPIDLRIPSGSVQPDIDPDPSLSPVSVAPHPPAGVTFRATRAPEPDVETCTKRSTNEVCWSRFAWTGERRQLPTRTIGKVTFDKAGKPYGCSGAVVSSANESVVWTAGHCVMQKGVLHENWAFAPGYRDGETPFGWWRPTESSSIVVPEQWEEDENEAFDFAAVVVAPNGGATLADTVGSQGIRFEEAPPTDTLVFGYPGEKSFDGEILYACRSPVPAWLRDPSEGEGEPTLGVGCDQPGGSSGGPFISGAFREVPGWGWVVSNVSYGWEGVDELTFGPYLGEEAQALWTRAESR